MEDLLWCDMESRTAGDDMPSCLVARGRQVPLASEREDRHTEVPVPRTASEMTGPARTGGGRFETHFFFAAV